MFKLSLENELAYPNLGIADLCSTLTVLNGHSLLMLDCSSLTILSVTEVEFPDIEWHCFQTFAVLIIKIALVFNKKNVTEFEIDQRIFLLLLFLVDDSIDDAVEGVLINILLP